MEDLIMSQIQALEISMAPLQSGAVVSYQEQNQLEIVGMYRKYFHNVKQAYLKHPESKLHQKLLQEFTLLGNSLWSECQQILNFIKNNHSSSQKQNTHIILSHFHYHSQSPLLALYCQMMGHRAHLLGSKKQITKGWSTSTVKLNQVDKVSGFKSIMASEGVQVTYYQDDKEDQIENIDIQNLQKLNIEIIDLFNTHRTLYKPCLMSHRSSSPDPNNKIYIYYVHPCQINQISSYMQQVHTNTPVHTLELNISFPYESNTILQSKFQYQLLIFLNEELNYPNKQDIIIFHENNEEYVKKLKNLLKKDGGDLVKHSHIIARSNQSQKQTLPPPPSFLTKMVSMSSPIKDQKTKSNQNTQQIKIQTENSQIKTESELKNLTQSAINSKNSSAPTKQIHTHNNIYIVPNYQTLIEWGYDLSHVFYIFDFRHDQTFHFDYQLMTYVETYQDYITERQALLRVSCMGAHKIGKYTFVRKDQQETESIKFTGDEGIADRKCKDIGGYCLQMIEGGFKQFWTEAQASKEIKYCLKALQEAQIIKKQGEQYSIVKPEILKCIKKIKDFNPILCSSILHAKHGQQQHQIAPSKMTILLAMASSILMTPGSLRQTSSTNNSVTNRPTQVWRQSGYLHSCIDILVRAKIIQHRQHQTKQGKSKKSVSRRMSKQTSQQWDVFGNLFQIIIADKITFDQMKIQDLLREEIVNENLFHRIVDITEKICDVVDIEDFVFSSFQDINAVLADIIKNLSKAIGAYSGSRRVGYLMKGQAEGIFPNKSSLLNILNQRPPFIYITRLVNYATIDSPSKYEILMCNSIPELTLMQTVGMLPTRKTNSYGETQIQYHGIASATFKALWRNNGTDIVIFQQKFGCFVQPNQQIAIISIHCPKQKQTQIKQQFDTLLTKIKQKIGTETKILHYLGSTSLLFGAGGKVIQPIKDKYINKCALSNLDLSVGVEDLQELFQEFFHLKDIKVVRQPPTAQFKTAFIEFHTQKDYYRFHEYYNQCLYLNRYLKISPIQSIPAVSTYKQQMYLEFTWTAWKSNCEAIVEFENEQDCFKCLESFKTVKLDERMVKTQYKNNNKIYFQKLNGMTDQINLESAVEVYGKVKNVEILKTPVKENLKSLESSLEDQIRKNVQGQVDIEVKKVEKLKNGLRRCRVVFKNQAKLNETILALNEKVGIMGVGRVHIKSWFLYPVKVAHGYLTLYQQLVALVLNKIPNNRIKIQNTIYNEQEYIVAKSHLKQEIDIFKQNINTELQGYDVPLTGLETTILLTEVGIRNLIDLQEKYTCRLIPDFAKKTLVVLALLDDVKTIKQEIKAKVQENFFYRISLNQKSFKHFKQNPELCQTMKKQYNLAQLQLEQIGRNLLLQGSANHVQKAFNYLMHVIQSVSKPTQQQMLNADVCGICCQQPFRPYRLQQCGHKFCMNCLLDSVNNALNDISMFPIKCPQCLIQIAIVDLDQMMTNQTWTKLKNIALNQFVGRNPEIISNCYTAGCKQVNFLIKNYFSCDQCQQVYCIGCKLNYHPGLTCQQAKQGGNAAFQKYMKQNGIRKCPNQSCKMPIMRTDGCYRVTCSRCNKSMCFKCQPQKMIAYDHYNDCYKHLTDVHGGYW